MIQRTLFLARLFGLFLLAMAGGMAVNRDGALDAISATVASPELLFAYAMLALAAGLAVVLVHNRWRDGATGVIVTLIGWLLLARAALLLCLPAWAVGKLYIAVHFTDLYYTYVAAIGLVGLFLTWSGFRRRASSPAP